MSNLQHERQARERREQVAQPFLGALVAFERPGELKKNGAEPISFLKDVEARAVAAAFAAAGR
jgi:hypothetical protein